VLRSSHLECESVSEEVSSAATSVLATSIAESSNGSSLIILLKPSRLLELMRAIPDAVPVRCEVDYYYYASLRDRCGVVAVLLAFDDFGGSNDF